MMGLKKSILSLGLFLSTTLVVAEVPVVDDSENYALLEEQAIAAPAAPQQKNANANDNFYSEEQALAHDNDAVTISDSFDAHEKIKNLRQEVQELRGQVEVLTHELNKLKEQQIVFYKDLDARIQSKSAVNLSENDPPKPETDVGRDPSVQKPIQAEKSREAEYAYINSQSPASRSSANTTPADEQISYLQAYELVKSKQFPDAVRAMQSFITKYPNGYYTANAQYWLGELYLADKNYTDAIAHFAVVLQQYPSSNKYSASLLKMGYALAGSGRYGEAKEKLREVVQKYPDTNTSSLARNKLEEISSNI